MKKILKFIALGILVLILLLVLLGQTNFGNIDTSDIPEATFISVQGESLHYIQKGEGRDILFIHGTPGSVDSWKTVFEPLSKDFRITAYDRPGHGYSSANHCDYTIAQNASIVQELIKELKLVDPLIVGHSYGGSIAAHLAVQSDLPKSSKLVIVDSPLYEHKSGGIYKLVSTPIIGKAIALLSKYTIGKDQVEQGLKSLFMSFPEDEIDSFVKARQKLWTQPKVTFSTSSERMNYDQNLKEISSNYTSILHDVTIITGVDEQKTLHVDCTRMKQDLPAAELIVFDNTGHFVQFEKTAEVLYVIRDLMEEE